MLISLVGSEMCIRDSVQAEGSAQDKEDIEYQLDKKYYQKMPQQVMNKA